MTLADDRRSTENRLSPDSAILVNYADDPYTWSIQQAEFLQAGRLDLIDGVNLAEEIAALAQYLADKLRSDLSRVLQHLLKWDFQPQVRSRSWVLRIEEHRRRVSRHLDKGPGLKGILTELLAEAYQSGRTKALDETGLPRSALPAACPYTWDEIMSRPVDWPDRR